jgi:WD40 repeat protein
MAVKNDPRRALKGNFQATVTSAGIRLVQGKKVEVVVAVGTPAQYLGGNRLALLLDGQPVTFAVSHLAWYQARLARDLVAFLSGELPTINSADYRLERYLYFATLLPIGIPFLTRGGAIWGALGFGLVAGCFSIAQVEKLPSVVRFVLMLGLSTVAYAFVGALMFASVAQGPSAAQPAGPSAEVHPSRAPLVESREVPAAVDEPEPEGIPVSRGRIREPSPLRCNVARLEGAAQIVQFLPDSRTLVTKSGDGVVSYWNADTGQKLRSSSDKDFAGISRDAQQAFYKSGTRITHRRLDDGRELPGAFEGDRFCVTQDGKRIVTLKSQERKVRSYNLSTGDVEASWDFGTSGRARGLALSPDGTEVVVSGCVRDLATGGLRASCHFDDATDLDRIIYREDGRVIAAPIGNTFSLYDAATGDLLQSFQPPSNGPHSIMAFSGDGKKVASVVVDGNIRLWDIETGKDLAYFRFERVPHSSRDEENVALAFSPDGRYLAVGFGTELRIWDVGDLLGAPLTPLPPPPTAQLPCVNPAAGDPARRIGTWNGELIRYVASVGPTGLDGSIIVELNYAAKSLAFAPDGRLLALDVSSGILLLDMVSKRETGLLRNSPTRRGSKQGMELRSSRMAQFLPSMSFSADGATLVAINGDNVDIWDVTSRHKVQSIRPKKAPIAVACVSPDRSKIALGSAGVQLWNRSTESATELQPNTETITESLAFSPDGNSLAAGNAAGLIRLWDLTGMPTPSNRVHREDVCSLAFSPDGRTLASGATDKSLCLWDLTRKRVRELPGQPEVVTALAFSPDGKRLCSWGIRAAQGAELSVWDVESGRRLGRVVRRDGHVTIAFSTDGKWAASTGNRNSRTLRIWDLTRLTNAR